MVGDFARFENVHGEKQFKNLLTSVILKTFRDFKTSKNDNNLKRSQVSTSTIQKTNNGLQKKFDGSTLMVEILAPPKGCLKPQES